MDGEEKDEVVRRGENVKEEEMRGGRGVDVVRTQTVPDTPVTLLFVGLRLVIGRSCVMYLGKLTTDIPG